MRKSIGIDMDGVIADLHGKWLSCYNADYEDNLTPDTIRGARMVDCVKPECGEKIYEYFDQEHFFRDLDVMEGSQDVIRELSRQYDIYIVTAAMDVPMSFRAKFEWLKEHFAFIPESNFVFCGNKSIIGTDYLIDDHIRNLRGFKGQGLLYTAFHNLDVTEFIRVNNWREISEYFLGN
ncbi:5' nucleotidase, NT5C type [Ferviditalea candida]|uniref:5'-3'-deoxyribonucleotidase n=1 Tax=Ferviditalea candida TaxID=3108399 RepID=A0ABU5ZHL2_9BACL|nr:5'-3'-deoxyribonucleotidase [Paenibacillaceae bacterium T2]